MVAAVDVKLLTAPRREGFSIIPGKESFLINSRPGYPYAVFDLSGKILQQGITAFANETIFLPLRKKGVYFVKACQSDNSIVKKIVVPFK